MKQVTSFVKHYRSIAISCAMLDLYHCQSHGWSLNSYISNTAAEVTWATAVLLKLRHKG